MALQVLALLKERPLSKSEIAMALGKSKPSRYLNDLMKRLLEAKRVAYTIPDKPNSRLQKYRLVDWRSTDAV
jgi:ATP-dependent DNA helicase RecG